MSVLTNIAIATLGATAVGGAYKLAKMDVNVVNTPNVSVVNTPNVNVPNGVAVTSMPSVRIQEDREPVHFEFTLISTSVGAQTTEGFYVVPAGKRLHVTNVSGYAAAPSGIYISLVGLMVNGIIRNVAPLTYMPGLNYNNYTQASFGSMVDCVAESGDQVGMYMGRSNAIVGTDPAEGTMKVEGYLTTNP